MSEFGYQGKSGRVGRRLAAIVAADVAGYRTRGGARVVVRDSYNYYPRDRYYERRSYYRGYDDGPRAGVGIRAPGVSVGVGVGSDRW